MDRPLTHQWIENYINNRLDPEDKNKIEEKRQADETFDKAIAEYETFYHALHSYADRKILQEKLYQANQNWAKKEFLTKEKKPFFSFSKLFSLGSTSKKSMTIAAIFGGGIVFILYSVLSFFTPTKSDKSVEELKIKVQSLEQSQQSQGEKLNTVISKIPNGYTIVGGGTGFAIDKKGYILTNAHVLEGSSLAIVVNSKKKEFLAELVYADKDKDLAILQIKDEDFKPLKALPYKITKSPASLGASIFTLGFPRNEIVVSMGFISARTGYKGDSLSYQLEMNINPGNSGAPVFNSQGEIIGVLTSRQIGVDGIGFAVKSKYIYQLLEKIKKQARDSSNILPPTSNHLGGMDRTEQIGVLENYMFFVKAYNK